MSLSVLICLQYIDEFGACPLFPYRHNFLPGVPGILLIRLVDTVLNAPIGHPNGLRTKPDGGAFYLPVIPLEPESSSPLNIIFCGLNLILL